MLSVNIKKRLGGFHLDVQFEAREGIFALLGASGCGKSMTLKCIAGIERPDEGRIVLGERVLFDSTARIDLPPQQRRVGYLFQSYALFPHMTVRQNIAAGVQHKGKAVREEKVREKIQSFYLEGMEDKYPFQLSGGQQQRVALARIFASEPEILLLDEPFSALDSYLKWQVEQELVTTLEAFPGTTVFVSHNRDEVYRLCQQVCLLSVGKSEEVSSVRSLYHSPRTLSAALLSGCKNYSRAQRVDSRHVRALDWGVNFTCSRDIPEDTAYIGVRAHLVSPGGDTNTNVIPCRIRRLMEDVLCTIVTLSPENGAERCDFSRIHMELSKEKAAGLQTGDPIAVCIDPADLLLLK